MGSLLKVEIARLFTRRLLRVLFVLCLVAIAIAGGAVFINSRASDAEVAEAESFRAKAIKNCIADVENFGGLPPEYDSAEEFCLDQVEEFGSFDPRFAVVEIEDGLKGSSPFLLMIGWLLGASSIGAEWHHRSLTTTLTWEPRRMRVLIAKALGAVIVVGIFVMVIQVLIAGSLLPSGLIGGVREGADAEWFRHLLASAGRITLISSICALVGFSIATLGRNTAAALGAGFAYLAIIETLIRGLKPAWTPWLFADNAAVAIGEDANIIEGRSIPEALLLLSFYGVLLWGIAASFFKARDVN